MMITEEIEIPSTIHASGGFADVRIGNYMGRVVALKVLRADAAPDNSKIRKASINDPSSATWNEVLTTLF